MDAVIGWALVCTVVTVMGIVAGVFERNMHVRCSGRR